MSACGVIGARGWLALRGIVDRRIQVDAMALPVRSVDAA
jgi:hypothetical protein